MVTLSQAPGNRLCHSLGSVRVKGDAASRYDAGDTFITACAPQLQSLNETETLFQHTCQHVLAPQRNFPVAYQNSGEPPIIIVGTWLVSDSLSVSDRIKPRVSLCMSLSTPLRNPLRLWNRSSHTFPASLILMTTTVTTPPTKGKTLQGPASADDSEPSGNKQHWSWWAA